MCVLAVLHAALTQYQYYKARLPCFAFFNKKILTFQLVLTRLVPGMSRFDQLRPVSPGVEQVYHCCKKDRTNGALSGGAIAGSLQVQLDIEIHLLR